jgi:uncharacterized protein (TIGR03437 family)
VNNDGNLLYNSGAVGNVNGTMNSGSITLFDTSTFRKLAPTLTVNSPGVALSPDGKILYLNNYYPDTYPDPNAVYGIDATLKSGLTPLVRIPIPLHPFGYGGLGKLAIDPSGKFAYATHSGYLEVIDLVLKSVVSVPINPANVNDTADSLGIAGPPVPVTVTIQPPTASMSVGEQIQFTASVINDPNTGVIWSTSGPGTLTTGLYTAPSSVTTKVLMTITATSVADATKSASATITLTPPGDIIASNTIFNAASILQGPVAPGEIVNVFGAGFGPADSVIWSPDDSGFVPTQLAGLRLLFDGIPGPILYAGANQVRAVVPYEVGAQAQTQVQVEYQGQKSNPVTLLVTAVAPGIFTLDSSGAGQAMLLNEDGSQNSPSNPATVGSRVVFYATGLGESNPPGVDGQVLQAPFPKPLAPVTVAIGGMDVEVLSVGGAPGSVAGLVRVCVRVPDGAPSGDAVSLDITVGGVDSQPGVTLAIQ